MSPERARAVWANRTPFGEVDVTPEEKAYVTGIWVRMPGCSCWADALLSIANGQAEGILPMIGTAVYFNGARIIDQSPVYLGETVASYSVYDRAHRAVEMLNRSLLPAFYGASVRFCPLGT